MKSHLIAAFAVTVGFLSFTPGTHAQEGPPSGTTCQNHKENLELYLKVNKHIFNERDVNRAEEFFGPEFANHNGPDWAPLGSAAIRYYLPMLAKAFSDRAVVLDFSLMRRRLCHCPYICRSHQ